MSFTRRNFLLVAGLGSSWLIVTACTQADPAPTPGATSTGRSIEDIPAPSALIRSNWAADPFALGAVSYLPVGATPSHRENLAQPVKDRLFFAGEATATEPSTIRGARSSGARAATEIHDLSSPDERIAVIGAGAAGAECARRLLALGHKVIVIEARDRIGGRIHSVAGTGSRFLQLGAWHLDEESDAELLDAIAKLGVASVPILASDFVRDSTSDAMIVTPVLASGDPSQRSRTIGEAALEAALTWAVEQTTDSTLAEALLDSGASETAESTQFEELSGQVLLEQHLRLLATRTGAEASSLSAWFAPRSVLKNSRLVTGSLAAIVDKDLEGVETFLSTVVAGISYDNDGVRLRLGTGESLSVDRTVVTVPLGVLKAGSIEFSPLLPLVHRAAIDAISVGNIELVIVRFDQQFWKTDAVNWSLLGTSELITTWVNLLPLTGESVLVGLIGADAALALHELSDDDLTTLIRTSLLPFAQSG
ncbi:MAG: FAD-dependent oxidoreductase [Rhodoglobus sp.]